jgi:hypothetical protein
MSNSPTQVLQSLPTKPTDGQHVKGLTTPDVTYVSLSENNPELTPPLAASAMAVAARRMPSSPNSILGSTQVSAPSCGDGVEEKGDSRRAALPALPFGSG